MRFPIILAMSVTVLCSIASPIVRRDEENNALIGYYDGQDFRTKVIRLKENSGIGYVDRVKIYYAEVLLGPKVKCVFEEFGGEAGEFTNEQPLAPYNGHLSEVEKIQCWRVKEGDKVEDTNELKPKGNPRYEQVELKGLDDVEDVNELKPTDTPRYEQVELKGLDDVEDVNELKPKENPRYQQIELSGMDDLDLE